MSAQLPAEPARCDYCSGYGVALGKDGLDFPCGYCNGTGFDGRAPIQAAPSLEVPAAEPASDNLISRLANARSMAAERLPTKDLEAIDDGITALSGYANTHLQTAPVCPHCGCTERDAWEWNFGPGLEGECIHECNSCGESFRTYREVSVYYTTSLPEKS